jgi:hypothetical protein
LKETLICRGRVMEPVRLEPDRLHFGQVSRRSAPQSKTVVLTRGDGGPLEPKLLPVEAEGVRAELREIEPGERYEIEVVITPPFNGVDVSRSVKLETGVPQAPSTVVPIYANLRPRVVAEPKRFSVPQTRESPWQQSVHLVWDDDAPHKIVEATVNDPKMTVRVIEVDGKQQVVLEVPPDYALAQTARSVTVKTDDTEAPVLRVPIVVPRDTEAGR